MGAGAVAGLKAGISTASDDDMKALVSGMSPESVGKLKTALGNVSTAKGEIPPPRKIGKHGMELPPVGIGMMSVGGGIMDYNAERDEEEAFKMIEEALKLAAPGKLHLDTSDVYGANFCGDTEKFIGRAIEKFGREGFFIATKFSLARDNGGEGPNGKPEYVKLACKNSLERMGISTIDLYYMHRMDKKTAIEDTCKALKELVDEGKIRYIGLSECPPFLLRRATKVAPISVLQQEWSLFARDLESDLVPCCRELGVGVVAYSPMARGLLTGAFKTPEDFPKDWRSGGEAVGAPEYMAAENLADNLKLSRQFCELAAAKGCTPAQLALAWVLSKGDDVAVIPGSKNSKRMRENFGAADVVAKLSKDDLAEIEKAVPSAEVKGKRYTGSAAEGVFDGILESDVPPPP